MGKEMKEESSEAQVDTESGLEQQPQTPIGSRRGKAWLIIASLLILMTAAGSYFLSSSTRAKPVAEGIETPTSSPKIVDPYDGWQEVKINHESLSLRYPKDWNVVNLTEKSPYDYDTFYISNSSNSFAVIVLAHGVPLDGGCDCKVVNVKEVSIAGRPTAHLHTIESNRGFTLGLNEKKIDLGEVLVNPAVQSIKPIAKTDSAYLNGMQNWLRISAYRYEGTYPEIGFPKEKMTVETLAQFQDDPDVKLATQIIQSLKAY